MLYQAPELHNKGFSISSSGVWALRCLFYEILTGSSLYQINAGTTVNQLILRIRDNIKNQNFFDQKVNKLSISEEFKIIILKMLQCDDQKRTTIKEINDFFQQFSQAIEQPIINDLQFITLQKQILVQTQQDLATTLIQHISQIQTLYFQWPVIITDVIILINQQFESNKRFERLDANEALQYKYENDGSASFQSESEEKLEQKADALNLLQDLKKQNEVNLKNSQFLQTPFKQNQEIIFLITLRDKRQFNQNIAKYDQQIKLLLMELAQKQKNTITLIQSEIANNNEFINQQLNSKEIWQIQKGEIDQNLSQLNLKFIKFSQEQKSVLLSLSQNINSFSNIEDCKQQLGELQNHFNSNFLSSIQEKNKIQQSQIISLNQKFEKIIENIIQQNVLLKQDLNASFKQEQENTIRKSYNSVQDTNNEQIEQKQYTDSKERKKFEKTKNFHGNNNNTTKKVSNRNQPEEIHQKQTKKNTKLKVQQSDPQLRKV